MEIIATSQAEEYIQSQKNRYQKPCLLIYSHSYKICIKTATVYRVDLAEFNPEFNQRQWMESNGHDLPIPIFLDRFLQSCAIKKMIIGLRKEQGDPRLVVARLIE